jgi:flagellar motor switch/type III secretory pathway protein FliN/flagellar biogenesis protein FliO
MASQDPMNLLTSAEQALASIPLPSSYSALPTGTRRVPWETLDARAGATTAPTAENSVGASLDLQLEFGRTRVARAETANLRRGAVVTLDGTADELVEVYTGKKLIARGEVLAVGGNYAVRVVELIGFAARVVGLIVFCTCPLVASAQETLPSNSVPSTSRAASATGQQLTLKPRSAGDSEANRSPGGLQSVVTVVGSLAIVLGVFFLLAWVLRRTSPSAAGVLPSEVFEVLGRAPLGQRQQVRLLRCGNKLLLVSGGAPGCNTKTLTEITDPLEVNRLASLCRQVPTSSPAAGLLQMFRRLEDRNAN